MKDQKGFSLIEVVIAIGLLGVIAASFLGALGTASKVLFIADERATAESLARSQMEYVKKQAYNGDNVTYGTYATITGIPQGYTIYGYNQSQPTLFAQRWDPISGNITASETGIQRIAVTVGHGNKPAVIKLEDYKARRY